MLRWVCDACEHEFVVPRDGFLVGDRQSCGACLKGEMRARAVDRLVPGVVTVDRAAIRIGETVYAVPRPGRHHTVIHELLARHGDDWDLPLDAEQGFVLTDGRFVDRDEAAQIALDSGQIDQLNWPPMLFSEDLY